jgi:conjugative transfer region protein (TIGR03750 family)
MTRSTADADAGADAGAQAIGRRAPVTARVNVEPNILNGMTMTEAKVIGALSMGAALLAGAFLFALSGYWQIVLLLAIFVPMAVLWFGSKYLSRIKRGRPDGFYGQAIHSWSAARGMVKSRFMTRQGWWGLGRGLGLSLVSPFEPPPEKYHPKKS